jgi:hypothetical protein
MQVFAPVSRSNILSATYFRHGKRRKRIMDEEGIAQELILDSESETHISEDEIL